MRIFFALAVLLVVFTSGSIAFANEMNTTDTLECDSSVDVVSNVNVDEVQEYSNNLSNNNLNDFNENTIASGNTSVKIDVPDVELYYKNGTHLVATLSDVNGENLSNKSLKFEISKLNYTRTTNSSGQASIAINLVPGNYSVNVYYLGDDNYSSSNATASVSVLPTIFADDIVKYYLNDTQYYVFFLDNNGNPLINTTATMNINGRFYSRTTNEKGIAKLNINLPVGSYILTAYHPITNGTLASNIEVLPTVLSEDIVKYYRNDTQYYATFLNGTGDAVANTLVKFNINGVFYHRTTNGSGVAKMDINLPGGTYVLTAYHPINNGTTASTIEVLPVISGENIVKVFQDPKKYSATFLNSTGAALANTGVKFNINGVFYTRTTDDNGTASLPINLPAGKYVITAYHPNGYAISNTVDVLASSATSIVVKDYSFYSGDTKKIEFRLCDQLNYGIANQQVSVAVNGQTYTPTTNDDGVASLTLNLDYGEYNATYAYAGTDKYAPSTNSSFIEVYEGYDSELIAEDAVLYSNSGETYNVTLVDGDGNPIANETVYMGLDGGKMYPRLTDANGTARLTVNWGPGNYNMVSIFNATNYKPLSVYSLITVIKNNVSVFSGEDITIGYGYPSKFTATLKASDVPLFGRKVIFNINGMNYTRTTDIDGVAGINVNLPVGSYVISYYFDGEDRIAPSSGKSTVTVKERISTAVTWVSSTSFVEGSTSTLQVKLTDANNNPLSGKDITFIISSKEHYATTDGEGVASLSRTFSSGTYSVAYKYDGNNDYAPSEGITQISVASVNTNNYGYWVFGRDMQSVNLETLSTLGTGNIFLNFYAFELYGESGVLSWIKTANSYGINVHIWMQAFYDGDWINPVSGGSPNQAYFNKKIDEAKYYAGLSGVTGVHLDYLRYPSNAYRTAGAANAINQFVSQLTAAVKAVNKDIIVSAAVMPETTNNIYFYGQDIQTLSKYLDVIIPMQYKGNYNSGSSWLTSTTNWFVANSNGAQVWSGLQTYVSDDNAAKLTVYELTNDAQTVLNAGADGVVLFRWGITNFIDFNSLYNPSYGGYVSMEDILSTATNLKESIEANGALPKNIAVGEEYYSVPQVLAMMSQAILVLNDEIESDIIAPIVSNPDNSSGDDIYSDLFEEDYLQVSRDIYSYCISQRKAPDNINSSIGLIKYETLVYMESKILSFIESHIDFPKYVIVNNLLDHHNLTVTMCPSASDSGYVYGNYTTTWLNYCPECEAYGTLLVNPKHTPEGELTCYHCDCDYCGVSGHEKTESSGLVLIRLSDSVPVSEGDVGIAIPIGSIIDGAAYVKYYIEENEALPDYVVLPLGKYSMPQFLYLMGRAITMINSSSNGSVTVISVDNPSTPAGDLINGQLSKDEYVDVANRVANFVSQYSQAPNYASSNLGKIAYSELLDSFSRILEYYGEHSTLPSSVQIVYEGQSSKSIADLSKSLINGLTTDRDKAVALYNYVRDYISYSFYYNSQKGAEGTLTSGSGNCCDQAQLLVAMARSVGLTVRFATGYCTFSSGSYGHVWVQFNIDGSWINADPTSNRNSFGVINNWNTNTYSSRGVYDVLPY